MTSNQRSGPIAHIRVLDITQVMAGAYCSMLLADMGADVIKVERPGLGDDARRMTQTTDIEMSRAFVAMNRNKRGISVDLKTQEGIDSIRRLVRTCDVLVQNFRPGVMDRLGLGYDELGLANPGLIYCSVSGFGSTGPYKDLGGFDLVAQAMSGLMSVTGTDDGQPIKIGVPICDLNAGIFGALGILAALNHRQRTGKGQHVETSLLEAGIAASVWESDEWFETGTAPKPMGSSHRLAAPYQALATSDGHIVVGAPSQVTWERLCVAIERPDLLARQEYASNASRLLNRTALATELSTHLSSNTTAEWIATLRAHHVPCGPVHDIAQAHGDPHTIHRKVSVTTTHPVLGEVNHLSTPVRLSSTPLAIGRTAPLLGQHTREVMAEAGYTERELEDLIEGGVLYETPVSPLTDMEPTQ